LIFRQITHDDLGCASYLIGDDDARVAAVVDPRLDIDEYLRLARYLGVHIEHVLETHNHADHVSGHGRLVAATGATVHIHREAEAAYEHEPIEDGWELELGSLRIRALHTPGHRPEHTAFALVDLDRGTEPWAVLTGDTLFVGDIARPDLAVEKAAGARGIFRSLREKLLTLPDTCEVWPGHLGGSLCGGPGMDLKVSSTIGFERDHEGAAGLRLLDLAGGEGAHVDRVLDVRTELQFDEAHVPGAVCITAHRAGCGSKLAWLARPGQALVLVGRDDEDARAAAALAGAVGLRDVAGFLAGGMTSWREDALPVESVARLTVPELHARWSTEATGLQVLDVRERDEWDEWDAGHIPGSVHTPYHDVDAVPDGIAGARPVAVICGSGQRAAIGASLLQRHGARDVIHVVEGGVPLWKRQGWPIDQPKEGEA